MDPLTFYFDRNFGKRFPQTLERARPPFKVEYQHSPKNKFKQSMPDDQWLEICGKRGWIAFSHDSKFQSIGVEATAIRQHGVSAFSVWGAEATTWAKLFHFISTYKRIAEIVASEKPPYLYRLGSNGRPNKVDIDP